MGGHRATQMADNVDTSPSAAASSKRPAEIELNAQKSKKLKEDDVDFEDDGAQDDESTLLPEEDEEDLNELGELENLAEMPIEELRAKFAAREDEQGDQDEGQEEYEEDEEGDEE